MPSRSIHVAANSKMSFFFMAEYYSHIYVCVCVIYIYIYTPHLLYLSVDRHLGCLHMLAIVKNASMNIGVHVSFRISVFIFFRYTPKSGIAGSHSSSIFSFLGTSILFSTVAAPMYIPINSAQGFPFLYILVNICYLCSFR